MLECAWAHQTIDRSIIVCITKKSCNSSTRRYYCSQPLKFQSFVCAFSFFDTQCFLFLSLCRSHPNEIQFNLHSICCALSGLGFFLLFIYWVVEIFSIFLYTARFFKYFSIWLNFVIPIDYMRFFSGFNSKDGLFYWFCFCI